MVEMTLQLQWAKANLPAHDKDEDAVFIYRLPDNVGLLLGVADGISTANGRQAARWIAQTMSELACDSGAGSWDARLLFEQFAKRLSDAALAARLTDSHSTLSCGIARSNLALATPFLRFEFFGIGDSPIWRVVRTATRTLRFQASIAYGPPVPSEMAGLYSWVNLGQGRVEGQVHFGSVDVQEGELLIVSTDGVPESRVLIDDQDRDVNSPRLIDRLMHAVEINDAMLWQLLQNYEQQKLLIDDDASLAVVRLARPSDSVSPMETVSTELTQAVALLPVALHASGEATLIQECPRAALLLPHRADEPPSQAVSPQEEEQHSPERQVPARRVPQRSQREKLPRAKRTMAKARKSAANEPHTAVKARLHKESRVVSGRTRKRKRRI